MPSVKKKRNRKSQAGSRNGARSRTKIRDYLRGECVVCGGMPIYPDELRTRVIQGIRVDVHWYPTPLGDCEEELEETLRELGLIE